MDVLFLPNIQEPFTVCWENSCEPAPRRNVFPCPTTMIPAMESMTIATG